MYRSDKTADSNEENARRTLESVIAQLSLAFGDADCVILVRLPDDPVGHFISNAGEDDAIEIMATTIEYLEGSRKGRC